MKQREIKFRAWHPKALGMQYRDLIEFSLKGFGLPLNDEETVLMQFTGLKDKNGKEIYEGDIIDCGGVVTFVGGRFVIIYKSNRKEKVDLHEDLMGGDKDKVIGNIYENPNLLPPLA